MEGRELAEQLKNVKAEPAAEEGQRQATEEKEKQSKHTIKKEKKRLVIQKQGAQIKTERPRGPRKEKKEPPAVE